MAFVTPGATPFAGAPVRRAVCSVRARTPARVRCAAESFSSKFEELRGRAVAPVADTVQKFNKAFSRPVPIVYRSIINEMITTTHLATVCAMWRYDALFAFGFDEIFNEFLRFYPNVDERDFLYKCAADCLGFDRTQLREAGREVRDWCIGKSEEEVFAALDAAPGPDAPGIGPVIEALAYVRDAGKFEWYYSRLFGIGLIRVMSLVGTDLTVGNADLWADKIGLEKSKFNSEMSSYLSAIERLKQAEQIFAESAAREAKKTADRLAERAKAAAKEAAALEAPGGTEQPSGSTLSEPSEAVSTDISS